jgi:hypothetical protein
VVATNQKLTYAQLQRLATQVHMSMGRAIQPFATANDGDILFAVTTSEVDRTDLHPTDLGVVASDLMWSAILESVPEIHLPPDAGPELPLRDLSGFYSFAPGVDAEIQIDDGSLTLTTRAKRDIFDIGPDVSVRTADREGNTWTLKHPFLERLRFQQRDGELELLLNPGPWAQRGTRISE